RHRRVHGRHRRGRVGVWLARHRPDDLAGHPARRHPRDHGRRPRHGPLRCRRQPPGRRGLPGPRPSGPLPVGGSPGPGRVCGKRVSARKEGRMEMNRESYPESNRRRTRPVAWLALALLCAVFGAYAAAQQGGRAVVSFQVDVSTLDPAIGYDWQNWSIIKSLFDGLMDYEPGTTNLKPHLAESYTVSEDGRTYTFTLRDGVLFHTGRELVAEDVKYSLERVLDPATQSPGQGFYLSIEGAQEFIDGQADEVVGIRVEIGRASCRAGRHPLV